MVVDATATRGVDLGYELRVQGGPRLVLRFRDGTLKASDPRAKRWTFDLSV